MKGKGRKRKEKGKRSYLALDGGGGGNVDLEGVGEAVEDVRETVVDAELVGRAGSLGQGVLSEAALVGGGGRDVLSRGLGFLR